MPAIKLAMLFSPHERGKRVVETTWQKPAYSRQICSSSSLDMRLPACSLILAKVELIHAEQGTFVKNWGERMHKVADWASLHLTSFETLQVIIRAYRAKLLSCHPAEWNHAERVSTHSFAGIDAVCENIVIEALVVRLDPTDRYGLRRHLLSTEFHALETTGSDLPFTECDLAIKKCAIGMSWKGSPADVMCLAHEAGHVAQFHLSGGQNEMPPIARETCAFLAELIVTEHLARTDAKAAVAARSAWIDDKAAYLDAELEELAHAVKAPNAPYTYRLNYPIARLAAVALFEEDQRRADSDADQIVALFKSSAEGMAHLPIARIASAADALENRLPPLEAAPPFAPAAYQSLGAMALLDIANDGGVCEQPVEQVYGYFLHHLQDETAFVGLGEDKRPFGYATWRTSADDKAVKLTHQTAPFGDHVPLQRGLRRHLGDTTQVLADAPQAARLEHAAW